MQLPPSPWTGVTSDSRRVRPGFAFVAIKGSRVDGHRFVPEALRRGATCVYSERPLPHPFPVPAYQVTDARQALATLSAKFYGDPAQKLRCIGTTGTNGKTTTTTLLQWILNTPRRRAGLMGTVHNDTGGEVENALLTTPDAETLHRGLAQMVRNGLEYAVLEVSSHGLKQQRLHGIPFAAALFTNLSPDHSDFHPTFADYMTTKAHLFSGIPAEGFVAMNADDPHTPDMLRQAKASVFTFGVEPRQRGHVDVFADDVRYEATGAQVTLVLSERLRDAAGARGGRAAEPIYAPERLQLTTPLFGNHNLANVLGAVTVALLEGVGATDVANALSSFPGVWRRQQRLNVQGPTIIDDCCHNPGSYQALFEALRHQPARRLHFVNAIRGSRGEQINRSIAQVLGEWSLAHPHVDLWVTDCDDTAGPFDIVTDDERDAFLAVLDNLGVTYSHARDLIPVLEAVAEELGPQDAAVLAGAHAMDGAASLFHSVWSRREVS